MSHEQALAPRRSARLGGLAPLGQEANIMPARRAKRAREAETGARDVLLEQPRKRHRPLPPAPAIGQTGAHAAATRLSASQRSHISHWAEKQEWPVEYLQQPAMSHLLARNPPPFLRRKRSEASVSTSTSITPSDQRPREEKNAPYKDPRYVTQLEAQAGSYLAEHELGVNETNERLCQMLLETEQPTPRDTIFRDDVFNNTCARLLGKNEARIVKDITPLIVPSAEPLATLGAKHLNVVVESVNEGWNGCVSVTQPRPQPDYALGFRQSAFSDEQRHKLQPFLGNAWQLSYFKGAHYIHFPFLTCEVKCGAAGLDIADRQNAHSMTVAVRGVVELFRRVGREQELHRQILAFSFSHNEENVRIWGHYPVIQGDKTTFWRHPIYRADFQNRNGPDKWVAYTFTKNVYDHWVTRHLERLCSAIDDMPDEPNFELSQPSEPLVSATSGLSQQLADHALETDVGGPSRSTDVQPITPNTSTREQPASKKKKHG